MMNTIENNNENSYCCVNLTGGSNRSVRHPTSDNLLVKELKELSVSEREHVYEEIHGVAKGLVETPELLKESLMKLQEELQFVPRRERTAYERALFLRPGLKHDDDFNLMFLRSDRHDPRKAARRQCQFFTSKLELFGDEKLAKNITFDDLSQEDIDHWKRGGLSVLERTDQSGRKVIFCDMRNLNFTNWRAMIRHNWYMFMRFAQDEKCQNKGVVFINFTAGANREAYGKNFDLIRQGAHLLADIPIRFVAIHYCFNDPIQRPLMYLFQGFLGSQGRLRFRAHYGTYTEARYSLLSYGITISDDLVGGCHKEFERLFYAYIAEQRKMEEAEVHRQRQLVSQFEDGVCALYPESLDVLVGRGRPFHKFPGNERFNTLIDQYHDDYVTTLDRAKRSAITYEIVNTIKASGGRFLERATNGWKIVDDAAARKKVSQAIRMKTRQPVTASPGGGGGGGGLVSSLTHHFRGSLSEPIPTRTIEDTEGLAPESEDNISPSHHKKMRFTFTSEDLLANFLQK